jgi:hypothetical protein
MHLLTKERDMATVDGKAVKVGDWVGFKCDIEQYGKIVRISGDLLTLHNADGFDGAYIGGDTHTVEQASRCWLED